jgi:hypothetical protein
MAQGTSPEQAKTVTGLLLERLRKCQSSSARIRRCFVDPAAHEGPQRVEPAP